MSHFYFIRIPAAHSTSPAHLLRVGLLASAAVFILSPVPAHAACSPAGGPGAQTITCNGTINSLFSAGSGDDTLNIEDATVFQAGADIRGAGEDDTVRRRML